MPILESAGRFASNWAKFGVTLAAVGWFGLEALDRVLPGPGREAPMIATSPVVESRGIRVSGNHNEVEDADGQETFPEHRSALQAVTQEFLANLSGIGDNRLIQVLVSLFVGLVTGLAGRPGVDRFIRWRRIQAARRRVRLFERDQLLLASVPSPQQAPNPPSEGALSTPVVAPQVRGDRPPQFPAV